jgi:hypothetical protein
VEPLDQASIGLLLAASQSSQEFRVVELGLAHEGLTWRTGLFAGNRADSVTHRPAPSLLESEGLRKGHCVPTCRDMSELASDYLEHTTPYRARVGIWLHLWRCEACRRYFDQLRRTVALLGSRPPPPPLRGTEERLLAIIRGRPRRDP